MVIVDACRSLLADNAFLLNFPLAAAGIWNLTILLNAAGRLPRRWAQNCPEQAGIHRRLPQKPHGRK